MNMHPGEMQRHGVFIKGKATIDNALNELLKVFFNWRVGTLFGSSYLEILNEFNFV